MVQAFSSSRKAAQTGVAARSSSTPLPSRKHVGKLRMSRRRESRKSLMKELRNQKKQHRATKASLSVFREVVRILQGQVKYQISFQEILQMVKQKYAVGVNAVRKVIQKLKQTSLVAEFKDWADQVKITYVCIKQGSEDTFLRMKDDDWHRVFKAA
jgi:ribosomal protein L23